MTIDTKTMVSISDANQNFSKVARLVDELFGIPKSQKSPHLKNAVWQHADSDVQPPTLYKLINEARS